MAAVLGATTLRSPRPNVSVIASVMSSTARSCAGSPVRFTIGSTTNERGGADALESGDAGTKRHATTPARTTASRPTATGSRQRAVAGCARRLLQMLGESATNAYPSRGSVRIQSRPASPSAWRISFTHWTSESSVTTASGQTACISSSLPRRAAGVLDEVGEQDGGARPQLHGAAVKDELTPERIE